MGSPTQCIDVLKVSLSLEFHVKRSYALRYILLLSCFHAVSNISAWILSSVIAGAADVLCVARVFEQPLSLGHCKSLFLPHLGFVYCWFLCCVF